MQSRVNLGAQLAPQVTMGTSLSRKGGGGTLPPHVLCHTAFLLLTGAGLYSPWQTSQQRFALQPRAPPLHLCHSWVVWMSTVSKEHCMK